MHWLDELVLSVGSFLAGFGARELVTEIRRYIRKRREVKKTDGSSS